MPNPRLSNADQIPWEGHHVYRYVKGPKGTGSRRYALMFGWPTPVSELARTKMPPLPGRPSYSRAARQWARAMLDANRARLTPKAPRRWIGAYSLRWLRRVARGDRPLHFSEYHSLRTYLNPPATAPVRLTVALGTPALRVGWAVPAPTPPPRLMQPGHHTGPDGGGFQPQPVEVAAHARD